MTPALNSPMIVSAEAVSSLPPTLATDGEFDAGFGKAFGVANRQALPAATMKMGQTLAGAALGKRLLSASSRAP